MTQIDFKGFSLLANQDLEQLFNFSKFAESEKKQLQEKVLHRLNTVVVDTAITLMSDEQFKQFQQVLAKEAPEKINASLMAITKDISNFGPTMQANIQKEIAALKQIV